MESELIIDIRSVFAEELAVLLKACGNLIEKSPDDPGLGELKLAVDKFTKVAQLKPGEKTDPVV